jgi:hypothetical protein
MRGIIWGANRPNCGKRFDKLIKDYKTFWNVEVEQIKTSKDRPYVKFSNEDIWYGYVANKSNRLGRRANICLIDTTIDDDLIEYIRCTIANQPPYAAIGYYKGESE